jgi:hypothetical protein
MLTMIRQVPSGSDDTLRRALSISQAAPLFVAFLFHVVSSTGNNSEMPFVYLLHTRACSNANETVYKVGKTKNFAKRLTGYTKGVVPLMCLNVSDADVFEKQLKLHFGKVFKPRRDYGTEYFEGNAYDMQRSIWDLYTSTPSMHCGHVTEQTAEKSRLETDEQITYVPSQTPEASSTEDEAIERNNSVTGSPTLNDVCTEDNTGTSTTTDHRQGHAEDVPIEPARKKRRMNENEDCECLLVHYLDVTGKQEDTLSFNTVHKIFKAVGIRPTLGKAWVEEKIKAYQDEPFPVVEVIEGIRFLYKGIRLHVDKEPVEHSFATLFEITGNPSDFMSNGEIKEKLSTYLSGMTKGGFRKVLKDNRKWSRMKQPGFICTLLRYSEGP